MIVAKFRAPDKILALIMVARRNLKIKVKVIKEIFQQWKCTKVMDAIIVVLKKSNHYQSKQKKEMILIVAFSNVKRVKLYILKLHVAYLETFRSSKKICLELLIQV